MNGNTVALRGVSCRFTHAGGAEIHALRGIDLEIPTGQFVCIVGKSGGGKSTLVRAVAGLTPLACGGISVDGRVVTGPGPDRAMVFQEDTVFPWMRVAANVEFGLKAQGLPAAERQRRVREWLLSVGLGQYAASWPKELSGGMRKRVALATVFATGAPVLIMDEPFGALDYVTRLALHQVLLGLWQKTGCTIIFVTHDIEEALVLGDRILVVRNGEIADDMAVNLPRPRREEERASPQAVFLSKRIVELLTSAEAGQ
jgi:NitT/TauT family transport system ATP-binding protein